MSSDPAGAQPPPLAPADLAHALVRPGGLWRDIQVVASTGSTNTDLLAAAAAGAPEGTVLAAEAQTAGRGRMGRAWQAAPGATLMFSVLLRPAVPASHRGWVPLLSGVAAVAAMHQVAAVDAVLKWPNDVLAGGRKLAGILTEQAEGAIVVGIGINVSAVPPGLPAAAATCLQAESGAPVSRQRLLVAMLGELEHAYRGWAADPAGSGLRQRYQSMCGTIGRPVRVELPGGREVAGTAVEVDAHGRLIVRAGGSDTAISAGDVVHVG